MVNIGNKAGKITRAVITNMDKPLGYAVGNAIEVKEAVEILKGNGDKELKEICIELASNMLYIAGRGSLENCKKIATAKLENGDAFDTFKAMVQAHGGDTSYVDDPENSPLASFRATSKPIKAAISSIWTAKSTGLQALLSARGATKRRQYRLCGRACRKKENGRLCGSRRRPCNPLYLGRIEARRGGRNPEIRFVVRRRQTARSPDYPRQSEIICTTT